MITIQTYKSPVGELLIGSYKTKLILCDWKHRKMRTAIDARILKKLKTNFSNESSEVIEQTIVQLKEYFNNKRKEFDIPIQLIGTDFQQSVWRELQKISYGTTLSYLTLSKNLNNHKAIRAVASANGANAISILIPCHRIIGSDNKLIGYAGGLTAKKQLLELENSFPNNQLSLTLNL